MSIEACPDCGHFKVVVSLTCHTWPGGTYPDGRTRWMHCQGCDSALEYSCHCWLDDEVVNPDDPDGMLIYQEPECNCMWSYTHGLNKANPRSIKEEEYRPSWVIGDLEFSEYGFPIAVKGFEWF